MTSKWIQSAPAATTSRTSSPRRAKSADNRLGAILNMGAARKSMNGWGPYSTGAVATARHLRLNELTRNPVIFFKTMSEKYSIDVRATAQYVPEQSDPEENRSPSETACRASEGCCSR